MFRIHLAGDINSVLLERGIESTDGIADEIIKATQAQLVRYIKELPLVKRHPWQDKKDTFDVGTEEERDDLLTHLDEAFG